MNRFSKILILVILIIFACGGIFIWQYLSVLKNEISVLQKEISVLKKKEMKEKSAEDKTTKCSPIDFKGYELAKNYNNFNVDLNNDGQKEIVRVYWDSAKQYWDATKQYKKVKPIMVKVFSGTENCPKEVFSFNFERGNKVGKVEILQNFWGDGSNAVLIEDIDYCCGYGIKVRLRFLTYREGKYLIVEGPETGGSIWWEYMFTGENGLGKKIIVAEEDWESDSDYCYGCPSKRQFIFYIWDGEKYKEIKKRITQNKYTSESIEQIIQKERDIIQ